LQLRGYAGGQWSERRQDSLDGEQRSVYLGGALMWNVADRLRLDADARAELTRFDWASDMERSEETRASVVNEVCLEIYLEDRLSLQPYAELSWYERDVQAPGESYARGWSWGYGLTFLYWLDGLLF